MSQEPSHEFLAALGALTRALEEVGSPAMIIGGVAVIALGVPRLTIDIDATIAAERLSLELLVNALERQDIAPRIPDAIGFARERQVLLAAHRPSGTPIDISLAWLPFEKDALAARTRCDFAGIGIHIARAEDLLIYKMIASRPKDVEDAEGLLALHGPTMDLERVRGIVRHFADLLEDDGRPQVLERLIRRTLP